MLLTPFAVARDSAFPYEVGKALFSRSLIEIAFGLWVAALVAGGLRRAAKADGGWFRLRWTGSLVDAAPVPPRSRLLLLAALGLLCYAAAAALGVSWQRSVWSNYDRMQGLVDAVHWFAFLVLLCAARRGAAQWRAFFNINLAASVVVGWLAIASHLGWDVPFYGRIAERQAPRIAAVLGNPGYLGIYAVVNCLLAVGLLARSLCRVADGELPERRQAAMRVFWLAAVGFNLYALILSGSYASFLGLGASALVAAAGLVYVATSRWLKRVALVAAAFLLAGAVATVAIFLLPEEARDAEPPSEGNTPLAAEIANASIHRGSFVKRRVAWDAGWQGFVERPLFGWGPENFIVVFGAYAEGIGHWTELHDYAHNRLVEEAVGKGLAGVAVYLAQWLLAFAVLLRALRGPLRQRERVLALFVGSAFAGYGLQLLSLFESASLNMLAALMLGYVVHLEMERKPGRADAAFDALAAMARAGLRRAAVAAPVAVAALGAAGLGLSVNRDIHAAAAALLRFNEAPVQAHAREAIAAFPPLANRPRLELFEHLHGDWRHLKLRYGAEARTLLAWVDAEVAAAVAAEPDNWFLHNHIARMYRRIAATEPSYGPVAERHVARSLQLAPDQYAFVPPQMRLQAAP